jgi:hypothetical protein
VLAAMLLTQRLQMRHRFKIILTISAVTFFILAFVLDISQFGQFRYELWKNISITRLLLIVAIITAVGLFFGLFLFRRKTYKERITLTLPIAFILFSLIGISNLAINYYGLAEEYNYFSAKRDIQNGKVQLLEAGLILPTPNVDWDKQQEAEIIIANRFGYKSVYLGCTVTHGIGIYNNVMEDYLDKVNGKNWRVKSKQMFDSLMNSKNLK